MALVWITIYYWDKLYLKNLLTEAFLVFGSKIYVNFYQPSFSKLPSRKQERSICET